jgi:hypothetical protein
VQLAAGEEAAYRANCALLLSQYDSHPMPQALVPIVLTLVAGETAVADMNRVLNLATQAVDANPADQLCAILLGAARQRARHDDKALMTLTAALSSVDLAPAVAGERARLLVGRLVGEMLLAAAYRQRADRAALEKQLDSLRQLIAEIPTPAPQASGSLPPWIAQFAIEIAKREQIRLSASITGDGN